MTKSTIGNDSIRISFSHILMSLITLLSAMLLSRYRSLEEYGTYSQILLISNIFSSFFTLGLPNSISFFLATSKDEMSRRKFLSAYYTISTILGIFIAIVVFLSSKLIVNYFDNPLLKGSIYVIAILPWAKIIISSLNRVLIIYSKTKRLIVFQSFYGLLLLSVVIFTVLLNINFTLFLILFILVQTLFALIVYLYVYKYINRIHFYFRLEYLMKIFNFSLPLGMAAIIGTLNKELDKMVIGYFFDTKELAIYANAGIELPFAFIASSFTAVTLPIITIYVKDLKISDAISLWKKTMVLSFFILSFISLGVIVFAPDVISLLYSKKYLPGVEVFRIYTSIMLLRFTYFGMFLNAYGKTKLIMYSSLAALIVNIILNFTFYYAFGFVGPAYATLVSVFLMLAFQLTAASKLVNMNVLDMLPIKNIFTILLFNLIMGISFYFIKESIILDKYVGSIVESILLSLLWGTILLIVFRKFIGNEWKSLKMFK